MDCPRCAAPMEEQRYDAHGGRAVDIDVCVPCQMLWFDQRESLALTPGSTLRLFRAIGEEANRPTPAVSDLARCPRCRGRLRLTKDLQRHTRFEYLRCPNGHGRLITFLEFLKEKDFVRTLTAGQIEELRRNVQMLNCSNCGGPIDLAAASACGHCGSPLSMLDMGQAGRLIAQLQAAERAGQTVDPALPLALERARRQTEATFDGMMRDAAFARDLSGSGLVFAGLHAVVRWLKPPAS